MKLQVLGSNSKGNCYIISNKNEALILELGISFKEIKKALDWDLSKVVGAIVSHRDGDHSKSISDACEAGLNVYGIKDAFDNEQHHHRHKHIQFKEKFYLGGFSILAFDVRHDKPCAGFLIHHKSTGNILFLTDTIYCAYTFKNLSHILIETNYSKELMAKRLINDELNMFLRNRVLNSHMALETASELLQANDLSKVQNIVCLHLSDANSDAQHFKQHIQGLTGKNTLIAEPGLEVDLSINGF